MAMRSSPEPTAVSDRSSEGLLPELVEHLRQNRTLLREEWARRRNDARTDGHDSGRNLLGGHGGVRQLRRGS